MKINFPTPHDGKIHMYCLNCHVDGVQVAYQDGQKCYMCSTCGQANQRCINLGDGTDAYWWIDDETKELWHESAGVFVQNPDGKYLFFERTEFPKGLTIPAGHVDFGETADVAAPREVEEEVGIQTQQVANVANVNIVGDSCSRGADVHKWHVYKAAIPDFIEVQVREEGRLPVWLTLEEAKQKQLPFAIAYILNNYAEQIERA